MSYPANYTLLSNKDALLKEYKGKRLDELPTPALIVDKKVYEKNCQQMLQNSVTLGAGFRAHVKSHKTLEGSLMQLGTGPHKTDKIVVSTLLEAWNLIPVVEKGLISDILFSLPVFPSRLDELNDLASKVPHLRLMVDNAEHFRMLTAYNQRKNITKKWSVFVKINMGTNRAGLINDSQYLDEVLKTALTEKEIKDNVEIYGFYCHAGHSYSADSTNKAKDFLLTEISHANKAAKAAVKLDPSLRLQISVGATPTAHAAHVLQADKVENEIEEKLYGELELHAGNYPFCDLQQVSTGCIGYDDVSCKVLAEVASTYPERGTKEPGEQLVNAGCLCLGREFGPLPGHGRVVSPEKYNNWIVGRLSQEHGILTQLDETKKTEFIPLGSKVLIIPQHSCITAALHPYYFVVDGSDIVVDVWVPWRGW